MAGHPDAPSPLLPLLPSGPDGVRYRLSHQDPTINDGLEGTAISAERCPKTTHPMTSKLSVSPAGPPKHRGGDMAEREGFEPSVACATHDFQSCTFGHSVISPEHVVHPRSLSFRLLHTGGDCGGCLGLSSYRGRIILPRLYLARNLTKWRRGGDSNPRYGVTAQRISNPPPSSTRPPLQVHLMCLSMRQGSSRLGRMLAFLPVCGLFALPSCERECLERSLGASCRIALPAHLW